MEAMTCIYMMRCIYIVDIWSIVGGNQKSDSAILEIFSKIHALQPYLD